jgi:hypothetical protein
MALLAFIGVEGDFRKLQVTENFMASHLGNSAGQLGQSIQGVRNIGAHSPVSIPIDIYTDIYIL